MSKRNMSLEAKIKALKPSSNFTVTTETEQKQALKVGRELKKYGQINFDITTRENGKGGWKVGAL